MNFCIDVYLKAVEGLSRLLGYIAALLLIVSVVVVCQMVFVRFVLNEPTQWQTEFVTYALLASTFIGAPWVLLKRGHVFVELVPMMLGARGRFLMALLAYVVSAALCIMLTWYGFEFWKEAWDGGWTSESIWAPKLWMAYAAMPIGFFAISLQYIADVICLLNGRDHPFGLEPATPPEVS